MCEFIAFSKVYDVYVIDDVHAAMGSLRTVRDRHLLCLVLSEQKEHFPVKGKRLG